MESLAQIDGFENMMWLFPVIVIFYGLAQGFFGYKLLRFFIGVVGFVAGFKFGINVAQFAGAGEIITLGIGIVAGLGGTLLAEIFYMFGVFLIGAFFGGTIASSAMLGIAMEPNLLAILGAGLVVGLLTVYLQRPLIILATSFSGSAIVLLSVIFIITGMESQNMNMEEFSQIQIYLLLAGWGILGLAGTFYQHSKRDG